MKKLLGGILLFSAAAFANGEIFVSECFRYPAFNPAAMSYLNNGPSLYGAWYYDLIYKYERTVILLDGVGHPACERPLVRSTIEKKRFEIAENHGTKAYIEKQVKAYLAAHEIEKCP